MQELNRNSPVKRNAKECSSRPFPTPPYKAYPDNYVFCCKIPHWTRYINFINISDRKPELFVSSIKIKLYLLPFLFQTKEILTQQFKNSLCSAYFLLFLSWVQKDKVKKKLCQFSGLFPYQSYYIHLKLIKLAFIQKKTSFSQNDILL